MANDKPVAAKAATKVAVKVMTGHTVITSTGEKYTTHDGKTLIDAVMKRHKAGDILHVEADEALKLKKRGVVVDAETLVVPAESGVLKVNQAQGLKIEQE